MTHADRLRLRLLAAIVLTEGVACDGAKAPAPTANAGAPAPSAQQTPAPKPEPTAKTTMDPARKPEPEPTAKTTMDPDPEPTAKTTMDPELQPKPEPDLQPRPTCPSGNWCGVMRPPATGPDTAMGCPALPGPKVASSDKADLRRPPPGDSTFDPTLTKTVRDTGKPDACCYQWVLPCPGGRPLVEGARVVTAELGKIAVGEPPPLRPPHPDAAAAWLRDAADEYASVASFARAAVELMAVGAPAELVGACHRAALDELDHARACAELAWSLGARHEAPRIVPPVAPRPSSLARLAADTFIEGCVGETLAALALRTAASRCEEPAIQRMLDAIAQDEERHAALAWQTVRWARDCGGADVLAALHTAWVQARPPAPMPTQPVGAAYDRELARCGRLDALALAEVQRCGWRDVIDPLIDALLVQPGCSPGRSHQVES